MARALFYYILLFKIKKKNREAKKSAKPSTSLKQ